MNTEATRYGLQRFSHAEAKEKFGEQGRLALPQAIETLEKAIQELRALDPTNIKSLTLEWSWVTVPHCDTKWFINVERDAVTIQAVAGPALAAQEPDGLTGFAKEAADRFWRTRGQR